VVSHIKERTSTEGTGEQDAEENIWIQDGRNNRRLEKNAK
jgi:hypothetical protein